MYFYTLNIANVLKESFSILEGFLSSTYCIDQWHYHGHDAYPHSHKAPYLPLPTNLLPCTWIETFIKYAVLKGSFPASFSMYIFVFSTVYLLPTASNIHIKWLLWANWVEKLWCNKYVTSKALSNLLCM